MTCTRLHETHQSADACLLQTSMAVAERLEVSELLERVAAHDELAFTALYQRTRRRVHGLATRILVDSGLAEDVTQEVYLQIWRDAGNYNRSLGSGMSWLMMITHRRAVDKVRSHQGSVNRDARYAAATQTPDYDDVVESVEATLDAEAVTAGLQTLSFLQHEAIGLAYYGGLTYRQVAEHLGQPESTVKSRIHDGLQRLRANLTKA